MVLGCGWTEGNIRKASAFAREIKPLKGGVQMLAVLYNLLPAGQTKSVHCLSSTQSSDWKQKISPETGRCQDARCGRTEQRKGSRGGGAEMYMKFKEINKAMSAVSEE